MTEMAETTELTPEPDATPDLSPASDLSPAPDVSPESDVVHPPRYRRRGRSLFRVFQGQVLIGAPGHKTVAIGGSAVFVWIELDQHPNADGLTRDEITASIIQNWPELSELGREQVQESLDVLLGEALVEIAATAVPGGAVASGAVAGGAE